MSLLDERGTGAISWQRNLAVLWCGVFFACASYTMVVPFLPVYLLQELHVESSEIQEHQGGGAGVHQTGEHDARG